MPNHELETIKQPATRIMRQVEAEQEEPETEGVLARQYNPLAQIAGRGGDGGLAELHAARLNRATDTHPARAGQSLLQLQRGYGNRYVQRVLAQAEQGDGDADNMGHEILQQADIRYTSQSRRQLKKYSNVTSIGLRLAYRLVQKQPAPIIAPVTTPQASGAKTGYNALLPGYSQEGPTCGASALVTALMVWDREHPRPGQPNNMVVEAINLILTHLTQQCDERIREWNRRGLPGEQLQSDLKQGLTDVRDHAHLSNEPITEEQYRLIGIALYALYVDKRTGLSANDIYNMHRLLGLESGKTTPVSQCSEIFENQILQGLEAGHIAQIGWYVQLGPPNAGGQILLGAHSFVIGRFANGRWFLSDQGTHPATEMTAVDLDTLVSMIMKAANSGKYWLYTGKPTTINLGGWTGVRLIGESSGLTSRATELIPPNTFLAEVDAGPLPWQIGEAIISGRFVARDYNVNQAEATAKTNSENKGAAIVEMPEGVYSVYETNPVQDRNFNVNGIDQSEGGLLAQRTFLSARLLLSNGSRTRLLQVY